MEWSQVIAIILANAIMFFWLRSEANSDRREANADRRDILNILNEMKQEMKDFHGRLCAIEEKNRR